MSANYLPQVAQLALGTPLLLAQDKLQVLAGVLGGRIGLEGASGPEAVPLEANRFSGAPRIDKDRYLYQIDQGMAVITIVGSLVNRGSWLNSRSGLISYEGTAELLRQAGADADANGVLLDIDSGGGEAGGVFALASEIKRLAASKPVIAYANSYAASAAYALACGCDEILLAPSASVGSIGVVALHLDQSGADKQAGKNYTYLHAGARKIDGNPHAPLSDPARANLQADIDGLYDDFCLHVAQARGISEQSVRETQARMFRGQAAVEAGLADGIASYSEALARLRHLSAARAGRNQKAQHIGDTNMSNATAPQGVADNSQPQADVNAAADSGSNNTAPANAAELAKATAAGVSTERERVSAILALPEAQLRPAQAGAAIEAGLDVATATKMLAAAEKDGAEEGAGRENAPSGAQQWIAHKTQQDAAQGDLAQSGANTSAAKSGLSQLIEAQLAD
ncbi:S49 family peptidase [Polycladidibacter hongkongensis]|uniref:S49 family peptidase n=1 Tax=Polycladidibacter hongkongensis TaxID=1647556 RepID=UPI00082C3926|nr:S49 family peptidase [Pseudovibrio hongkongensis]